MKNIRLYYFFGFLLTALLLAGGSYIQNYLGVNPCPLCILQRIVMCILGVIFLCGIVFSFNKILRLLINSFALLFSFVGILLSARQVWLQHIPHAAGANCEVGLEYMLKALPLDEVFQKVIEGGASCSSVEWRLLNFSLAEWSLFFFIIFAIYSVVLFKIAKSK